MSVIGGGVLCAVVTAVLGRTIMFWIDEAVAWVLPIYDWRFRELADALGVAVIALPGLVVAVVMFAVLPDRRRDGETRCRSCGYILRGLTEARGPECGERI